MTENGALDMAIATLQTRVKMRDAEIERLRDLLAVALERMHNDFEPDNQSRAYYRIKAGLDLKPDLDTL